MVRPIWSGALNFGLVTVPVDLYSATTDHTVHFRQFERDTSDRIRYRRVNERTGKEVSFDDIVKGYEVERGEYVLVEPEELEKIAPGRSRTVDIEAFVDLADIDPIFFQKSYWLAPAKEEFERTYGLLNQAMSQTKKAGIATFVMRGKEYLAAIRAGDGVLVLSTLHFAADLRNPKKELPSLPEAAQARGKELTMAVQVIESMSEEWHPEAYHDTYTARVEKLIKDKKAGRKTKPESEPADPTKVIDLFDALSRSVKGHKNRHKAAQLDVEELNKTELEELARKLNIKGRSKMSRAELAEAVQSARSEERKAS